MKFEFIHVSALYKLQDQWNKIYWVLSKFNVFKLVQNEIE